MRLLCALLAALVTAAAFAQQPAVFNSVAYRCDDGRRMQVDYTRDEPGAHVVITSGTKRWKLERAVAASGARYLDEKSGLEWWNKGRSGTLTELRTGKAVACREQPAPKK